MSFDYNYFFNTKSFGINQVVKRIRIRCVSIEQTCYALIMLTKDEKLTSSREYGEKKAIESIWNHAIASANILHVISFCFLSKENENGKAFTMRFFLLH